MSFTPVRESSTPSALTPSIDTRQAALEAIAKRGGLALAHLSAEFKNDRSVVMAAVSQDGLALQFASPALKEDLDIVSTALKQNGWALAHVAPELCQVKSVVFASSCSWR